MLYYIRSQSYIVLPLLTFLSVYLSFAISLLGLFGRLGRTTLLVAATASLRYLPHRMVLDLVCLCRCHVAHSTPFKTGDYIRHVRFSHFHACSGSDHAQHEVWPEFVFFAGACSTVTIVFASVVF